MNTDQNRRRRYKAFLYFYQNGRCAYCLGEMRLSFAEERTGGNLATLDHVKPACKNGKTSWENLVLCCSSCNHKKGSKDIKPVFPPLKIIGRKKGDNIRNFEEGGHRIYRGMGGQIFDTDFIKQTAQRIYEAPDTQSIATPLLFPANMVESIVSQPVLLKRGA